MIPQSGQVCWKSDRFTLEGGKYKLKMGKKSLFWEDSWLHDNPICIDHPTLYEICEDKDITVHEVLAKRGHLSFKRWLSPLLFEEWIRQLEQVFSFQFCNQEDIILWKWNCRKKVYHQVCIWLLVLGRNSKFIQSHLESKITLQD